MAGRLGFLVIDAGRSNPWSLILCADLFGLIRPCLDSIESDCLFLFKTTGLSPYSTLKPRDFGINLKGK